MRILHLSIIALCVSSFSTFGSDVIVTIGGNGSTGFTGDGSAAVSATLNNPSGITLDGSGNILVADRDNHCIRLIDAGTGIITTIAGNGTPGYGGDGNPATAALLNSPTGVAVDSSGRIYISDTGNHRIRVISGGNIMPFAGDGNATYSGDAVSATSTSLNSPHGIAVDSANNVYIADKGNNRIRKVDGITGFISTIAGDGTAAFGGDGAAATSAQINGPTAVAVDSSGNVFIADTQNSRVRKIDTSLNISTVAGNGTAALAGDGGSGMSASLNTPAGVAVGSGNVFIADFGNQRIRKVDNGGIISTVAGTTSGFSGDGSDATQAQLSSPAAVAVDGSGNYFIADQANQRIRKAGPSTGSNISITSVSASPSPARTTVTVTFQVQATQAQGKTLNYSWDFGDNSAVASGQTVSHPFAAEGTYNAVVTVTDGIQSVTGPVSLPVLGPNSGADGTANISTGKTIKNPIDGMSMSVPGSNGGVLDFSADDSLVRGISRGDNSNIKFVIDDGFDSSSIPGRATAHKYPAPGIFVTTTTVVDPVTQAVRGKVRKTIAISNREAGKPALQKPGGNDISHFKVKGNFSGLVGRTGASTLANDVVTFSGQIELPGGLNTSQTQDVAVAIGNIIDTATVSSRGVGTVGTKGLISGLKLKYPSSARKTPVLPAQQFATISFKLSGSSLSVQGFDTEGVSGANTLAASKTGTLINVQVLLSIAGETYEISPQVTFKVSTKGDKGVITGRSGL